MITSYKIKKGYMTTLEIFKSAAEILGYDIKETNNEFMLTYNTINQFANVWKVEVIIKTGFEDKSVSFMTVDFSQDMFANEEDDWTHSILGQCGNIINNTRKYEITTDIEKCGRFLEILKREVDSIAWAGERIILATSDFMKENVKEKE